MELILIICVVIFLTIPVLFTVQTARKVGKPTIGLRAPRSPEWLAAMRELDELEFHPALRYFPVEKLDHLLPLIIGYQPVPDSEKVQLMNKPSPQQRFIESPPGTGGVLTVPNTVTEAQLHELREYFLTSPTRGRILSS